MTVQKAARKQSHNSPAVISVHTASEDTQSQLFLSTSSQCFKCPSMGSGIFFYLGKSRKNHSYVASWAVASVFWQILPLVWKLLSSSPDVAA